MRQSVSRASLHSMSKEPIKITYERGRDQSCLTCRHCNRCCQSYCCSCILMMVFLFSGFIAGVHFGSIIERKGILREMGFMPPQNFFIEFPRTEQNPRGGNTRVILPENRNGERSRVVIPTKATGVEPKCILRFNNGASPSCSLCSRSR